MRMSKRCEKHHKPSDPFLAQKYSILRTLIQLQNEKVTKMLVVSKFAYTFLYLYKHYLQKSEYA